jgi:hypothetical protein
MVRSVCLGASGFRISCSISSVIMYRVALSISNRTGETDLDSTTYTRHSGLRLAIRSAKSKKYLLLGPSKTSRAVDSFSILASLRIPPRFPCCTQSDLIIVHGISFLCPQHSINVLDRGSDGRRILLGFLPKSSKMGFRISSCRICLDRAFRAPKIPRTCCMTHAGSMLAINFLHSTLLQTCRLNFALLNLSAD